MFDRLCLYTPPLSTISSYYEMIDLASEYGIKQLETINVMELAVPDVVFARKLRKYADSKGISFPCVSAGINLVGEDRTAVLEDAKKYIEIAAILGSPYFHHTIAFEFQDPQIIVENAPLYYQRGIEAVQTLYDYAKQYNVRTIYEDQGFLFNGVEGFHRFLSDVDRDVGVVADFGNIHFVDQSIEHFIQRFSDRIVHVHVKDYIITPSDLRKKQEDEYVSLNGNYLRDCPIGQGMVPTEKAFRLLGEARYTGSISLECPPFGSDELGVFSKNLAAVKTCIQSGANAKKCNHANY